MSSYSVALTAFAENLRLTPVYLAEKYDEVRITTPELNRAGMILYGFMQ